MLNPFQRACAQHYADGDFAHACDRKHIRIASGSEYEPDVHLLSEWHPQAA